MSSIQRELDRVRSAIPGADALLRDRLMIAQQALEWALEPSGFAPPYETIFPDSAASSAGCSAESRPPLL